MTRHQQCLRRAIREGSYAIDPERIATRMIEHGLLRAIGYEVEADNRTLTAQRANLAKARAARAKPRRRASNAAPSTYG